MNYRKLVVFILVVVIMSLSLYYVFIRYESAAIDSITVKMKINEDSVSQGNNLSVNLSVSQTVDRNIPINGENYLSGITLFYLGNHSKWVQPTSLSSQYEGFIKFNTTSRNNEATATWNCTVISYNNSSGSTYPKFFTAPAGNYEIGGLQESNGYHNGPSQVNFSTPHTIISVKGLHPEVVNVNNTTLMLNLYSNLNSTYRSVSFSLQSYYDGTVHRSSFTLPQGNNSVPLMVKQSNKADFSYIRINFSEGVIYYGIMGRGVSFE